VKWKIDNGYRANDELDPEVQPRAQRRRYPAEYKLRNGKIVATIDLQLYLRAKTVRRLSIAFNVLAIACKN
jgi:hypothetical protein